MKGRGWKVEEAEIKYIDWLFNLLSLVYAEFFSEQENLMGEDLVKNRRILWRRSIKKNYRRK